MHELRVNPPDIHQSGMEIGDIAATMKSAFVDCDARINSAQSGWVGSSAAALTSMAAEWLQATNDHDQSLIEHSDNFIAAAKKYGRVDESEADSVRSAAEDI